MEQSYEEQHWNFVFLKHRRLDRMFFFSFLLLFKTYNVMVLFLSKTKKGGVTNKGV